MTQRMSGLLPVRVNEKVREHVGPLVKKLGADDACARPGPAYGQIYQLGYGELPDDGAECASYGPNWRKSYGRCTNAKSDRYGDQSEKSSCCAPTSTLGWSHCDPAWCFMNGTCDNTPAVVATCSGPGFVRYDNSDASVGPDPQITTPKAEGLPVSTASIYELMRRANADPRIGGFSVGENGGLLWSWWKGSGPPISKPGITYYAKHPAGAIVTDPNCIAIANRNVGEEWTHRAMNAACGGSMIASPQCRQFVSNAKAKGIEVQWANDLARAYCQRNPTDREFCACINTIIPSPTCLDGGCTSKMGGIAYTTLAQDRQRDSCASSTICQQLFDFQGVACPKDPSLKSGACINIANNTFTQVCGQNPPPCKSGANCKRGEVCVGGACIAGCAISADCPPGQVCGANGKCGSPLPPPGPTPDPSPKPSPDPTPKPATKSFDVAKMIVALVFALLTVLGLNKIRTASKIAPGASSSASIPAALATVQ